MIPENIFILLFLNYLDLYLSFMLNNFILRPISLSAVNLFSLCEQYGLCMKG